MSRSRRLARWRSVRLALVSCALCSFVATESSRVTAQLAFHERNEERQPARIEPAIGLVLRSGIPRRADLPVPTDAAVVIEMTEGAALGTLSNVPGLRLHAPEGRPLRLGGRVLARVTSEGLTALEHIPGVRSVTLAPTAGQPPLARSFEMIDVEGAWGAPRLPSRLTGQGMTIADLDTAIDVFHPAFFRADAGVFDWIDVDGDGALTPRIDAIDLDRDRSPDANEIVRVLRAELVDLEQHDTSSLRSEGFDPTLDWLYLDLNGDGARNVGAAYGFDDSTPAFGEPLFVPDDVDRDGRIEMEERLFRLGTSKIASYYVHVAPLGTVDHVYRRGVDLSTALSDYTHGAYGISDTAHATGVGGILVGGVPLPSRRMTGILPDADLVVAFNPADEIAVSLAWALEERPDVVLHEYVLWTDIELDGSDLVSRTIDDTTRQDGMVHVCPVGNIAGSERHAAVAVPPGGVVEIPISVAGFRYVDLSLHHATDASLEFELIDTRGRTQSLTGTQRFAMSDSSIGRSWSRTTDRGFTLVSATVASSGRALPVGLWKLRARSRDARTVRFHAYTSDINGFAPGVRFMNSMASDESTVAWPATSDACIGVGAIPAYVAADGPWYAAAGDEEEREVRHYSARGPRIDGQSGVDLVAPDNPWAPLCSGQLYPTEPGAMRVPSGAFTVFGGTSGAAPHVAGIAALLSQSGVRGEAAIERLRATASRLLAPISARGAGGLDGVAALGGERGGPPVLRTRVVPERMLFEGTASLIVEIEDPDLDRSFEVRWDDDYDGDWDSEWSESTTRTVDVGLGVHRFKVEARDPSGRIAQATYYLVVGEDRAESDAGIRAPIVSSADAGTLVRERIDAPPSGCACRVEGRSDRGARGAATIGVLLVLLFSARKARRSRYFTASAKSSGNRLRSSSSRRINSR